MFFIIKNSRKSTALELLEELAQYVTANSNDDRATILSSGFDVTDEQTARPVTAIEALEVALSGIGEATLHAKNVKGAVAYVHEYTTELPGQHTLWVREETTTSEYTFKGLQSDKRHWFRVMAIGRGGQKAYSPVVSRAIQ